MAFLFDKKLEKVSAKRSEVYDICYQDTIYF